ncbi:golgin subfamily A member 6-like protein 2, partial [Mizuhopecten yessoensis]|uniref:golgin subfamily A member 6-like protein 2 n=1 Tax=Mizuhopecten yessoensis TaxID=6573 RepID=UPI000B45F266
NLKSEVRKHMEFISSNMRKFDNVGVALNEGQAMLGNVLCRKCKDAVRSKRIELHAKNGISHKKKSLIKLSPERQQIVNEITNLFIQLERSQNEDEGDEKYCTEEEYYRQEMLEMENMYMNKLFDKQDEVKEMENEYKKEVKDKEAEVHNVRNQLEKMTIERDDGKNRNDSMAKKLKSHDKTASELRELKNEHKRLKEDLDNKECNIKKLKRELDMKEEDIKRYRPSSSGYRLRSFADNRDDQVARLEGKLNSRDEEIQTSRRENENLKSERDELLHQNEKLQEETYSMKETIDSRDEELQRSRRDNENLKSEQIELIGRLQDENRSLKEKL